MKPLKYLFLILTLNACKINDTSHNDYDIYNLMVNKLSGAENAPWLSGKNINYKRLKDRKNLKLYLKIMDSTEKEMLKKKLVLVLHDTCVDFKQEMNILKYGVITNKNFFIQNLDGDTSFKNLILDYKIKTLENKIIDFRNLNTKYKFIIKKEKDVDNDETIIGNIAFSNISYNKNFTQAILYASSDSSGFLYFLTKSKNKWEIKHQIQIWVS